MSNLIGILSYGMGGIPPIIEEKNIIENGTYNVPEGVDGFNPVNVNVPERIPVINALNVIENGAYNVPSGVDGFNPVNVNVPASVINRLEITSNGTYNAPTGVNGFNPVIASIATKFGVGNLTDGYASKIPISSMFNTLILENSMSLNYSNSQINSIWNGGTSIGSLLVSKDKLVNPKITYKITTGTAYHATGDFKLMIGLRSTQTDTNMSDENYLIIDKYRTAEYENTTIEKVLDCSGFEGYLYINLSGWNLTFTELTIE